MYSPEREYRADDVSVGDVTAFESLPDDVRLLACKMHALWTDDAVSDTDVDEAREDGREEGCEEGRQEGYSDALDDLDEFIRGKRT